MILKKYKEYYICSIVQLKKKYNLLVIKVYILIILVFLYYKVIDMLVEIEYFGIKWCEIGSVFIYDEFIGKFFGNEEI